MFSLLQLIAFLIFAHEILYFLNRNRKNALLGHNPCKIVSFPQRKKIWKVTKLRIVFFQCLHDFG